MLGIALVVEDVTKGQKVAFRYPGPRRVDPSSLSRPDGSRRRSSGHQNLNPGDAGQGKPRRNSVSSWTRASKNDGTGPRGRKVGHGGVYALDREAEHDLLASNRRDSKRKSTVSKDFWRLETELFAKLLRPTQAQCGRMLELVIDNLRFLSFPVQVDRHPHAEASNRNTSNLDSQGPGISGGSGGIDSDGAGKDSSSAADDAHEVAMFSLIFVLDAESEKILEQSRFKLAVKPGARTYGVTYPGSAQSVDMYRRAAIKVAHAMLYEEQQCNYISTQVRKMIKAGTLSVKDTIDEMHGNALGLDGMSDGDSSVNIHNEVLRSQGLTDISEASSQPHTASQGGRSNTEHVKMRRRNQHDVLHRLIQAALAQSRLAQELRQIYEGLSEHGMVHLTMNGKVNLTLTLQHPFLHPAQALRPYQAVLLRIDQETEATSLLNVDASAHIQRIWRYARRHGPLKSFEEMALDLGIPIEEIFRVAGHLVYWRRARVVHSVNLRNVYRVAPGVDLDPSSSIHYEFQRRFGNPVVIPKSTSRLVEHSSESAYDEIDEVGENAKEVPLVVSLARVLSCFSGTRENSNEPAQVSDIQRSILSSLGISQELFLEMLVWLMERGLIAELHQYHYFIAPARGDSGGPKKVRAGDTQSKLGSTPADMAAAAAHAADQADFAEAEAAKTLASQTTQSTQSLQNIHAEETVSAMLLQNKTAQLCIAKNSNISPSSHTSPVQQVQFLPHVPRTSAITSAVDNQLHFSQQQQPQHTAHSDTLPNSGAQSHIQRHVTSDPSLRSDVQGGAPSTETVLHAPTPENPDIDVESPADGLSAGRVLRETGYSPALQQRINEDVQVLETKDLNLQSETLHTQHLDEQQNRRAQHRDILLRNEALFLDAVASDTETYRIFRRLAPYLHGRHHSREIVWRECITFEQLEAVLLQYNEFVASFWAPSP